MKFSSFSLLVFIIFSFLWGSISDLPLQALEKFQNEQQLQYCIHLPPSYRSVSILEKELNNTKSEEEFVTTYQKWHTETLQVLNCVYPVLVQKTSLTQQESFILDEIKNLKFLLLPVEVNGGWGNRVRALISGITLAIITRRFVIFDWPGPADFDLYLSSLEMEINYRRMNKEKWFQDLVLSSQSVTSIPVDVTDSLSRFKFTYDNNNMEIFWPLLRTEDLSKLWEGISVLEVISYSRFWNAIVENQRYKKMILRESQYNYGEYSKLIIRPSFQVLIYLHSFYENYFFSTEQPSHLSRKYVISLQARTGSQVIKPGDSERNIDENKIIDCVTNLMVKHREVNRDPNKQHVSVFFVTDSQELKEKIRQSLIEKEIDLSFKNFDNLTPSIIESITKRVDDFYLTSHLPIVHTGVNTFEIQGKELLGYIGVTLDWFIFQESDYIIWQHDSSFGEEAVARILEKPNDSFTKDKMPDICS